MTIEQAIASYEKSAERYHKAFLRNKAHGGELYQREAESDRICEEHERQLAAWLRELQERRKAPEIVFCKDCARHNKSYGDNGAIDSCPLVLYRGKAQGHEFDYQYCAFAERRTDD
jgi:hypothetical protein